MVSKELAEITRRWNTGRLANEQILARLETKMRIALCTTSINVPRALALYRECDLNVRIFVATDNKTPAEAREYITQIGNSQHYWHGDGEWKCSKLIGFNTLARRNIAFLEALAWGAEVIVSVDDDNFPTSPEYFWAYMKAVGNPFSGLVASSKSGWFDAGQLLVPHCKHRGIPHGYHHHEYAPITKAKVGVVAGLVLGDSDVDATTRIEQQPDTHVVSELARTGVVVSHNTHTVWNTQNTGVIRELIPAWFLMTGVGRYDDIYASLIVHRVAKERGLHVHFGQPFAYQQRNSHDAIADLCDELGGMKYTKVMADLLDAIVLPGRSVISDTRTIYEKLRHASWIPGPAVDAAFSYLEDCEAAGCV